MRQSYKRLQILRNPYRESDNSRFPSLREEFAIRSRGKASVRFQLEITTTIQSRGNVDNLVWQYGLECLAA